PANRLVLVASPADNVARGAGSVGRIAHAGGDREVPGTAGVGKRLQVAHYAVLPEEGDVRAALAGEAHDLACVVDVVRAGRSASQTAQKGDADSRAINLSVVADCDPEIVQRVSLLEGRIDESVEDACAAAPQAKRIGAGARI